MRGSLNDKVKAQSLVDAVAERLESAIISGEFEPGSKLSEQALAKSLGVSRGPLREAIRRLEGRKLLQRTPNIGVRVATISVKDLSEIFEVQEVLQGMACALAAKNMDDAEIAALKDLLTQHKKNKSRQSGKGYDPESKDLDLDLDFHFRIARGSRNKRLTEMLFEDLSYLIWGYRYRFGATTARHRWIKALEDHKEIVAAIARRDPAAAEQRMREHIRDGRIYMEEHLTAATEESAQDHTPALESNTRQKVASARKRVRALDPTPRKKPTNGEPDRAASSPGPLATRTRRSTSREPIAKRG
jgi:DNA-binding GntR family transcriptional regulator